MPSKDVEIARRFLGIPETRHQTRHPVGHFTVAHEHHALIVDFGADDFPRQLQAHARQFKQPILAAPRSTPLAGKPPNMPRNRPAGEK